MNLTTIWNGVLDQCVGRLECCPWTTSSGKTSLQSTNPDEHTSSQFYTPEERARRDSTAWTTVQGVLAPLQFVAFAISLVLVFRYLSTGEGLFWANLSIVIKTLFLYAIMVTGSVWEKVVFGRYLFARMFFWEDVVSMAVIALHTAYLAALIGNWLAPEPLMYLALTAYVAYVVNAAQFLIKMRAARLAHPGSIKMEAAE